jgi:putative oxidoreductase
MDELDTRRLIFPRLARIYRSVAPYSYTLIRFAAGAIMIPHGVPKLFGTFAPVLAKNVLAPLGFPAPLAWAYWLGALEVFGGAMLALGLFTRPLALLFAFETAIIAFFVALPKGYFYSVPGGGFEYPQLLFILYVAIVLRGGERCAIDNIIAREF